MQTPRSSLSEILSRVGNSLEQSGDFPTQRRTIAALRNVTLAGKVQTERALQIVLFDPVLSIRALHRYGRLDPLHLGGLRRVLKTQGLAPLLDLEYTSIVVNDYRELGRHNPVFLDVVRQATVSGLLAQRLMSEWGQQRLEESMLVAAALGVGPTLLSYYFPRLYKQGIERARRLDISVSESISQMLGMPLLGLSISIAETLSLPEELLNLMSAIHELLNAHTELERWAAPEASLVQACAAGFLVSQLLSDSEVRPIDEAAMQEIAERTAVNDSQLLYCLEQIPSVHALAVRQTKIPDLGMPSKLARMIHFGTPTGAQQSSPKRQAVCSEAVERMYGMVRCGGSVRGVLACLLETLVDVLPFDRAVLLLPDPECKRLYGTQLLGIAAPLATTLIVTKLDSSRIENSAQRAFIEGRLVSGSVPMLPDASVSAAIPIGLDTYTIGVVVADRLARPDRAREALGDSVIHELEVLTAAVDDCLRQIESTHMQQPTPFA